MNLNFGEGDEESHYHSMVKKRIIKKKHATPKADQKGNQLI